MKFPEDKIAEVTAPPTDVMFPEPGPVRYAEAWSDGVLVGVVWAAASPAGRPRAGIINARGQADPQFQTELGEAALAFAGTATEPDAFLNFLAESRTGFDGTLNVSGDVAAAPTLRDVYVRLGYEY